jgi:RNA polymerase sigma factor (sigma-70 family)
MLDVSAGPGKFKRCIRLVIADPQPIVLMGLNSVFATQHDFEIVASCGCGTSCLEAIRNLAPDVALVAGTLPDLTISEILAIARAENLPTRLMFFAESQGDDDLTAAIAAGACNAVSAYADPDTILRSLRLTTEGASASPKLSRELSSNKNDVDGTKIEKMLRALTHRERQIVQLVSEGLSNKEIARELNVSRGTVKVHLYNIFQKLEVSNRTVLATIALLQRSTGFTTLSLALAFAMLSDVRTSDATDTLRDDDSAAKDLEHSVFEFCKKAILRHDIVADPGERILLSQKDSTNKEVQLPHSAGRMEGLHAAEQAAFSNIGKGYGTIGSSTLSLFISPFQQAINNSQAGNLTSLPPPAFPSHTIRGHGGSGLFAMTAAAMGVITLDNSHAALQACEPGKTLSDASVVSDQDGVTHVATINGHVDSNAGSANVENLASELVGQDSRQSLVLGTFGHDKTAGKGNAGEIIQGAAGDDSLNSNGSSNVLDGSSGDNTIKDNGGDDTIQGGSGSDIINGSDATIGMHGGDKLTGGHGDADSNSTRFDTIDFTIGGGQDQSGGFRRAGVPALDVSKPIRAPAHLGLDI